MFATLGFYAVFVPVVLKLRFALWLGQESPATTHLYIEADLAMKERALSQLQPLPTRGRRYHPTDRLLAFLEGL